jgi:enamine deaminase RidA (YjgF/YER057c/UK114 family)
MTQLDKSAHARNGASIEARMKVLGITLPTVATPAANYVTYVLEDGLLTISGQLPMENGAVAVKGKLGGGVSLEEGQRAAQLCALNLLAQANVALDGLGRIRRCVRLGGFVASEPSFTEQHKVVNGASDLIAAVLGEAGKHARSAVGVAALPLDAAVEVEAIFATS